MRERMIWVALIALAYAVCCTSPPREGKGEKVELQSDGWTIVGNFLKPDAEQPGSAVLLLHMMPTERSSFNRLAELLQQRGIASLRIDLRGHGESVNLGGHNKEINAEAWRDVLAALNYLKSQPGMDPQRIGVLGASYSGEHAARAGREAGGVSAYVIMSSGSFSGESVSFVAESGAKWWFIAAEDDGNPNVPQIMRAAAEASDQARLKLYEKGGHGTYLFDTHGDLEEQIAEWFEEQLNIPFRP